MRNSTAAGFVDIDTHKSDTDRLPYPVGAIYVGDLGTQGVIKVRTTHGDPVTLHTTANLIPCPDQIIQVYDTGTTATKIMGIIGT
ncbi:MAG: hypothetical protein GY774_24460 [Planctomycetes bacterium]|nr:hypothetical protein [Planctomycetota bacterium]